MMDIRAVLRNVKKGFTGAGTKTILGAKFPPIFPKMPNRLSSPFNLRERLHTRPDAHVSGVALASVALAAAFLFAMSSKYIYSPGLSIALDTPAENVSAEKSSAQAAESSETSAKTISLPVSAEQMPGRCADSVLTAKSDSMFICDGRIFSRLADALPPSRDGADRGTLLVKIDKNASVQGLFELRKVASEAGFSAIQIAGETAAQNSETSASEN